MAQLQFKGKPFVQNHHLLVKYHELVPVKSKSLAKNYKFLMPAMGLDERGRSGYEERE